MCTCVPSSIVFLLGTTSIFHHSCNCNYGIMECSPNKVQCYRRLVNLFHSFFIITCETQQVLCKPLQIFFNISALFFLLLCNDWTCILFQTCTFPSLRIFGIPVCPGLVTVDWWWQRSSHRFFTRKDCLHPWWVSRGTPTCMCCRDGLYVGIWWPGRPVPPPKVHTPLSWILFPLLILGLSPVTAISPMVPPWGKWLRMFFLHLIPHVCKLPKAHIAANHFYLQNPSWLHKDDPWYACIHLMQDLWPCVGRIPRNSLTITYICLYKGHWLVKRACKRLEIHLGIIVSSSSDAVVWDVTFDLCFLNSVEDIIYGHCPFSVTL